LARFFPFFLLLVLIAVALAWIAPARGPNHVVVYTSVDPEYALPLFERFTRETGIEVVARTDSEAVKTTGMLERLRELKDHPDGDVFWNSEQSGTLMLANEGLLAEYASPQGASIPEMYRDEKGRWTGFGCRARVAIFNTQRVKKEEAPRFLEDFADPKWRGRFCIARPLFGTTRSHLAAVVLALGEDKGFALLRKIRANAGEKAWIVDGNAAVRERVAEGVFDLGLTDTDDVYEAQARKLPVDLIFIGQTREYPGVFLVPNTVSILKGGPNRKAAERFVDFLLRPENEAWLAEQGARQIPVRMEVPVPEGQPSQATLKAAPYRAVELAARLEELSVKIDRLLRGVDQ
jgi:iron(III) transport system substrate-binding protein